MLLQEEMDIDCMYSKRYLEFNVMKVIINHFVYFGGKNVFIL